MIDWTRVDELIREIGAEDFRDVVDLFLQEVDDAIGGLYPNGSVVGQQQSLHLIKGCAWNLGFAELGRLCAQLEEAAAPLSDEGQAHITQTYGASRASFLQGLQQRNVAPTAA